MSKLDVDKFIDLDKFCKHDNGNIDWKNSVGLEIKFRYDNLWHTLKITNYEKSKNKTPSKLNILVDGIYEKNNVRCEKIKELHFDDLFKRRNYAYDIGDVVNGYLIVSKTTVVGATKTNGKMYTSKNVGYDVKCIKDGYEHTVSEHSLNHGHGCPVCAGKVVLKDVNSVYALRPDIVELFLNPDDACKYTINSLAKVKVKCPNCNKVKEMTVSNLVRNGYVTCHFCRDGHSYPNKFARNLFSQLSDQYDYYEYEWSPDWAGRYLYDNYIKLKDGRKIIVEMDGGQHYKENDKYCAKNDKIKDMLAKENGIDQIIRVDCNYGTYTVQRFDYIKSNLISSIQNYFDLSNVDWESCDESGNSSLVKKVCDYYVDNPKATSEHIAQHFHIGVWSVLNYLKMGSRLGMIENYRPHDNIRSKYSKPIKMYSEQGDLLGIYKSSKELRTLNPDFKISDSTLKKRAEDHKIYNGRIFEFITYEEWLSS